MRVEDIEIGTSGWKFDDWAGPFYPLRVPQSKWLEYYAARFPVGEINSTYYRIAPASAYAAIDRNTPESFRLFAKVHADVTHKRDDPASSLRELTAALNPLRVSGKLLGLLAQFPGSFSFSTENLDYVLNLRSYAEGLPLCAEFRNRNWLRDDVLQVFTEAGLTWVCPDEPEIQTLLPWRLITTSDYLYIRLHGRNAPAWYDRRAGDRYDYNYSEEQLGPLGKDLLEFESPAKRAFVLFNNCYHGQAPQNAWWLKTFLTGAREAGTHGPSLDELSFPAD